MAFAMLFAAAVHYCEERNGLGMNTKRRLFGMERAQIRRVLVVMVCITLAFAMMPITNMLVGLAQEETAASGSALLQESAAVVSDSEMQTGLPEEELAEGVSDEPMFLGASPDDIASGVYGTISWSISSGGVLSIWPTDGNSGVMVEAPWIEGEYSQYADSITSVVVEPGVKATRLPFYSLKNCTTIDLTNLDASELVSLGGAFRNDNNLTQIKFPSNINTSGVTSLADTFAYCNKLESLDISGWDVSNVTDMGSAFTGCSVLTNFDISKWDVSSVTNMAYMFYGCNVLTDMSQLSGWNTASLKTTESMFYNCLNLKKTSMEKWDMADVTDMSQMFMRCESLESIDLSGWDTSSCTNLMNLFSGCKKLKEANLTGWDTSKVTKMNGMFHQCGMLNKLSGVEDFDTSSNTSLQNIFNQCTSLTSLDLTGWDVSKVTTMYSAFNDCSGLTKLDVSTWNPEKTSNMTQTFSGCRSLEELDVSKWNTPVLGNMASTFSSCTSLKELDLNDWDTSRVSNFSQTFLGCSSLVELDLSNWDTSNVSTMNIMFSGCTSLEKLDISGFTVNHNKMSMFYNDGSLRVYEIGTQWSEAAASDMGMIFMGSNGPINRFNSSYDDGEMTVSYMPNENDGWFVKAVTFHNNGTDIPVDLEAYPEIYTLSGANDDTTVTIEFSKRFNVVFNDYDDTEIETQEVFIGEDAVPPTDPERTGYTFNFWSDSLTEAVLAVLTNITADKEVWANYTPNNYIVRYNGNGKTSGEMTDQLFTYDVAQKLYKNEFEKEGYKFAGWDNDISADEVVYQNEQEVKNLASENDAVVDLYAVWEPNKFSVVVDPNYPEPNPDDPIPDPDLPDDPIIIPVETGGGVDIPPITPPPGYEPEGYRKGDDPTVIPPDQPIVDLSGDEGEIIPVIIIWKANNYIVRFNAEDATSGEMEDQPFTYDVAQNLYKNEFEKTDYFFVGWDTDEAAETVVYTDEQNVINLTSENNGVVDLYAVWEKGIIVTAEAGEGGTATPERNVIKSGDDAQVVIDPANGYRIKEVKVNSAAIDPRTLGVDSDKFVLTLEDVVTDTLVEVTFEQFPDCWIEMEDEFLTTEDITFKAIGYWPDEAKVLEGDIKYVPNDWHHAEPSGDWDGTDDEAFDYSGKFRQPAGEYTIKVNFNKFVYTAGGWKADGTVERTHDYIVKEPPVSAGDPDDSGDSDVPQTGDDTRDIALYTNLMMISFAVAAAILINRAADRRKVNR